jgi:8-oxo-dGTP diphosphatase
MEYVVCLAFDGPRDFIALIKKARPAWQKDRYNGLGGKVKPGETWEQACHREFQEEGEGIIPADRWRRIAVFHCENGDTVHFAAFSGNFKLVTRTDEPVGFFSVAVAQDQGFPLIDNLRWLIPMALDGLSLGDRAPLADIWEGGQRTGHA